MDSRVATCASITYLSNAYRHCKTGDVIELWFTDKDKAMRKDTQAWAAKTGNEILEMKEDNGVIVAKIKIKKR
ncbi:MAG: sulfurtransferase TusA family protein [Thermoplasmata archaeon]